MVGRLAGKTSIVTGGASGFGAGIARAFAREGAQVLVADLNGAKARALAEEISHTGAQAAFHSVDVTDKSGVEAMIAACDAQFGPVEVLVANAGLGQRPCPFEDITDDELERQFAVNVRGVIYCCQKVLPVFRRNGRGTIVVTASGIALLPRPRLAAYGAAKAAVLNLAKSLALELAPEGIRVNAICPAVGDTPMLTEFMGGEESPEAREQFRSNLPLGRLVTPEEVASAAVFLASDQEAGNITGCALPVDGGRCI